MTEKAVEAKLNQQRNARKAKLQQLTIKRNNIESLMLDYANIDSVEKAYNVFCDLLKDFAELQCSISSLLPEEMKDSDHNDWYLPKVGTFKEFQDTVERKCYACP